MRLLARSKTLLVGLLLVAVACAAPAPGGAPQSKSSAVSLAPANLENLYDLAKKEGTLVWNIVQPDGSYQPIVEAFNKRYPDLQFEAITVSATSVPGRVITEHGAGKVSIDVSWGSVGSLMPLIERDLLPHYDWSGSNVNKARILLDGRAVKTRDSPWVWFYNKKILSDAEVPKSWEDLLQPRWKGKISLSGALGNLAALPFAWGEQRAKEYIEKLAKQEPLRTDRAAALQDAVIRGEILIGTGPLSSVVNLVEGGAPLDVAPISPQVSTLTSATSFVGAPHPNGAALLMSWLATDEAKEAFAKGGHVSFTKGVADHPQAKLLVDKKIELEFEDTIEKSQLSAKVRDEYTKMLGFAPN